MAVEDSQLRGEQTLAFAPRGDDELELRLELTYTLKQEGPLMGVTDLLFIRRALRDSLRREVDRFAIELATDRELAASEG